MATTSLGRLTLDLIARTGNFTDGMSRAERATDDWRKKVQRNAKLAAAAMAGVGTAVGYWIKNGVEDALQKADEMSKIASRVGVATESIAGLQMAFEMGGSSTEEMEKSLIKLADQAAKGNKAFEALGIKVRDSSGNLINSRELLAQVADKFAATSDGASKTALAVQLFGKAGASIIPILNGGSEGLREMDEQARKLGLTVDTETGKAVEEFNDRMDMFKRQAEGTKMQLMQGLLPSLNALSDAFLDTKDGSDTAKNAGAALGEVLVSLAKIAAEVTAAFKILGIEIGHAMTRASLWLDKNKEQNEIVAKGKADFSEQWKAIDDNRKARIKAAKEAGKYTEEMRKQINAEARAAREALGNIDAFNAKAIAESNKRYENAVKAAIETRKEMRSETEETFKKITNALQGGNTGIVKSEKPQRKPPQMPSIDDPASKGGKGGKGSKKSGGGKSSAQSSIENFARMMQQMQSEAAKLTEQFESMRVNDGLVSSYTKLSDLQRDMIFNADRYKGISEQQANALKRQAAQLDTISQKLAISHYAHDAKKRLDDMEFEISLTGKTAKEIERLRFIRDLEAQAKEKSIGMSRENIELLKAETVQIIARYDAIQQKAQEALPDSNDWLAGISAGFSNFTKDAESLHDTMQSLTVNGIEGVGNALTSLVTTGKANFRDFAVSLLGDIAKLMAKLAMTQLLMKTIGFIGGGAGGGGGINASAWGAGSFNFGGGGLNFAYANGGAFKNGVQFFASGGVFDSPTAFKTAQGLGVLGEAGPEAIMPLRRGRDGKLGIAAAGAVGGQNITINHTLIVNQADGSSKTESDAPAQYKQLMDSHFDKRLAENLRPGGALDIAIKQKAGK
ncbi:phage tail tape measure C-terminal domain-containing protein [Suttonella ornithocola]|uniref:Phage-related protein n=1 Tax=Suttonella ornithocola TaxID=279832 RepID=A0A380MU86_9GAMM|nr:phage tail tape measure C-terminal domain-containing protein [Suttonella ornithocola]SUO95281.1 Phage-related protein [Suttonella ornithocola]